MKSIIDEWHDTTGTGCRDLEDSFCDKVKAVLEGMGSEQKVVVSFAENIDLTAQCLVIQLVNEQGDQFGTKRFAKTDPFSCKNFTAVIRPYVNLYGVRSLHYRARAAR